jgi:hypothetical protein
MKTQIITTPAIDTLAPAIRQRKGDYVQGPDSDTGEWRIGRIIDKVAGGLGITGGFVIPKNRAYKLTREAFEKAMNNEPEEVEMEEIEEPELEETQRVRIRPDWSRYTRHTGITTQSGKTVIDINDYVAGILRGLNLDDAYGTVARYIRAINETATDAKDLETLDTVDKLRAKYGHLNPGMQRMNLGNKLRGAMARAGIDTLEIARDTGQEG